MKNFRDAVLPAAKRRSLERLSKAYRDAESGRGADAFWDEYKRMMSQYIDAVEEVPGMTSQDVLAAAGEMLVADLRKM